MKRQFYFCLIGLALLWSGIEGGYKLGHDRAVQSTLFMGAPAVIDARRQGADSLKKRLTPLEIRGMCLKFEFASSARDKALAEARDTGKLHRRINAINYNTLGAFQRRHRLSDNEMVALSTGALD